MDLRRKNNILVTIILVLILFILVGIISIIRVYLSGELDCECDECTIMENKFINKDSLDNANYIGIYNYDDTDNKDCLATTTLILNSDYSAIFYVGDCNSKAYYYGKYKIEDKKLTLYSIVLHDTTSDEEMYIDDEEIYFNIVDSEVMTSIYGRDASIRLKKIYNLI